VPAALHHQVLVAPGARPRRIAVFLHGILGQGQNWRSTATKLTSRQPGWAAALVDLRLHGRSRSAEPPHTVAAAADDVAALIARLAEVAPLGALVGHSFGGKVALALRRRAPAGLLATAVFDASPSARPALLEAPATPGSIRHIVESLAAVPKGYARRDDLVAALAARGVGTTVGRWLAMLLEPAEGGYALTLDLAGIRALAIDHASVDLWDAVEDPALADHLTMHVAGASDALSPADRDRLAGLAPRVTTIVHPGADHWMLAERDALALPEPP
jgi:pimeloyl-ACP methyl ester carboxylesterase